MNMQRVLFGVLAIATVLALTSFSDTMYAELLRSDSNVSTVHTPPLRPEVKAHFKDLRCANPPCLLSDQLLGDLTERQRNLSLIQKGALYIFNKGPGIATIHEIRLNGQQDCRYKIPLPDRYENNGRRPYSIDHNVLREDSYYALQLPEICGGRIFKVEVSTDRGSYTFDW